MRGCARQYGFSLVGVLVALGVLMIVFTGLTYSFQVILDLSAREKAAVGAMMLANERLEYIRSLPYADVGTVAGIVPGLIPQTATTSLNGITYTERVVILYKDDPADGYLAADTNGITADYKIVKVEVSWDYKGDTYTRSVISNVVPRGIESIAGGGTLLVEVFDALAQPVVNANVRIYNDTTTSTIDTTVLTNAIGQAIFSGAPAAANYQISTFLPGYSADQTYSATTSNPNPNPPHVAVLVDSVSSLSLSIDRLSQLEFQTRTVPTVGTFVDTFSSTSSIATSTGVVIVGDTITLATTSPTEYVATGTIFSTVVSPTNLDRWSQASSSAVIATGTTLQVHLYTVASSGEYTLVPDADLPGNSGGFVGAVPLVGLDAVTYSELVLGAYFETSIATVTPSLLMWELEYEESSLPVAGVAVDVQGSKTIGATAVLEPIYKVTTSTVTNASGIATIPEIEWDLYDVAIAPAEGYVITEACPNVPLAVSPNTSETVSLTLQAYVGDSLRVFVGEPDGSIVPGATVTLSRPGFSDSALTSGCGQVYFESGVVTASDYELQVSAPGYGVETVTGITVDGSSSVTVTISP